MVRVLSQNEIILNSLDFYRLAQPGLDTKFGTVARDILIDGPSTQLALVYQELGRIKTSQSLRLSFGNDLDKLANNYGETRRRGSTSTGSAILTFNAIETDIPINKGELITANNGATFTITNGVTVSSVFANTYRATASKFRADLDFVGITDQYAIVVTVNATAPGEFGNISKYALTVTSIPGVSNVTNAQSFGGGSEAETDAQFRSRILAVFSGANTGTALGYRNAILGDPAALDAIVVGPGNPLMTRDGTQVVTAEDGTKTIISEGTGGKVDNYIYGFRLVQILNSYIYRDKSNKNDPTNSANNYVLGQIAEDANKTVTTKRLINLQTKILPAQPVNNIIQVIGSSSGNFIEKQTDTLGRITGNYELIRDTGAYAGSPWGFDSLHWIDNKITGFSEDQTKGRFNGQDSLTFSDVLLISGATENIQISNENSSVKPSDRTSIQLAHWPVNNVSRVFNLTTGERYVVASQNPDGAGSLNQTGRITIRGSTLPAVSDILQVDYTWVFNYDSNTDFDNILNGTNPRSSDDSMDWGFSNAVRREQQQVTASGTQKQVLVTHPITSVISVNTFITDSGSASLISGRLGVVVSTVVTGVISIIRADGSELYDTSKNDGSFNGFTIFFPTDSVAAFGDTVTVTYNANDTFTIDGLSGSSSSNIITLPDTATVSIGTTVECNYISNIRTLLPSTIMTSLPAVRDGNGFNTQTATGVGTQPTTHIFSSPGVIQSNLRQAPSVLQLSISGSISPGVITVLGTTFSGIYDSVFTVSNSGLKHDLSTVIKSFLKLKSNQSVPSNVGIVRIISVEKVQTNSSFDVLSVENVYEIKGYQLKNNAFFKKEAVFNNSLTSSEFILPETVDNTDNMPDIGDRLRVTFYIATTSDTENVSFTKSGVLYTNKVFALVDSINKSSGFTSASSQTAALTVSNQNQPSSGSRYSVIYNYTAPKTNERITISYQQNKLIADTTLAIESTRPIGADVLNKASVPILVNASFAVVVSPGFENSKTIVKQNVQDAVTNALNATALGTIIDESDLMNAANTVEGVDRVRPVAFNVNGKSGRVLSIEAGQNEYIQANLVTITIEDR